MSATQTARVLQALRDHETICQGDFVNSPAIDGKHRLTRLAARIQDLKDAGHRIDVVGKRDRYALYKLVEDTAVAPAPTRLPQYPTLHVCDACGYRFKGSEWPQGCSSCGKGPHWLASFHTVRKATDYIPFCHRERKQEAA